MKKLLFLMSIMFVLTLSSFGQSSQKELTGAIGLTFGSDRATVKSILLTKGSYYEMNDINVLGFTEVSVGTRIAGAVLCNFVDNKLYRIICSFEPSGNNTIKAQELYDNFVTILTAKYGRASNSFRLFDYPFEDKSEDWDLALESNKATIDSFWFMPDKETGNCIILSIDNKFNVTIEYQCTDLMKIAIDRQKNKDNDAL